MVGPLEFPTIVGISTLTLACNCSPKGDNEDRNRNIDHSVGFRKMPIICGTSQNAWHCY